MRLILVRHGQAGRKSEWNGDDAVRPLDSKGRRQAQVLAKPLGRFRPSRIISSPYLRCRETVEPLAAALGLRLELSEVLAPDGGDKAVIFVEHLIEAGPATATVVLSTHREVLVVLLPALAKGVELGHRLPGAKGSCWVMQFSKKRLTSVRYHTPHG